MSQFPFTSAREIFSPQNPIKELCYITGPNWSNFVELGMNNIPLEAISSWNLGRLVSNPNLATYELWTIGLKSTVVLDVTPCSPVEVDRRFGGTYCLNLQGWTVSQARNQEQTGDKQMGLAAYLLPIFCLAHCSTLKMEATRSSKTSADFYRITRRCNPEGRTLHTHCLVTSTPTTSTFNHVISDMSCRAVMWTVKYVDIKECIE
jgi:hypothetical protein